MIRISHILVLAGILGMAVGVQAQSLPVEYRKMVTAYGGLSQCSARVKTYLYVNAADEKPASVISSETRFNESGQWTRNEHMEMLYNRNCVLMIDHLRKQVQYSRPVDLKKNRKELQLSMPDSALLRYYTVIQQPADNGQQRYLLETRQPGREFSRMEYLVDSRTHFIREIIYYADETKTYRKIRVVYEFFESNPQFTQDIFSEKSIISGKGDKVALVGKYSGYKLLNGYTENINNILRDE